MNEELRKSLITQLKNSFEEDLPDISVEPRKNEETGSFVSIGDTTVPKNDVYEAIDFFTQVADKLGSSIDSDKLKKANYCKLAKLALSILK